MTEILQKLVVNCETGIAEYLPLSAEEIAEREAQAVAYAAEKAKRDAEQAAADAKKQATLDALAKATGLSAADIQAALS